MTSPIPPFDSTRQHTTVPPKEPNSNESNAGVVFKTRNKPAHIDLGEHTVKDLTTSENPILKSIKGVFNRLNGEVEKSEEIQGIHVSSLKTKHLHAAVVKTIDGKLHLEFVTLEKRIPEFVLQNKENIIFVNHVSKKIYAHQKHKGINLQQATVKHTPASSQALKNFQQLHSTYSITYLSDEDWDKLLMHIHENLLFEEKAEQTSDTSNEDLTTSYKTKNEIPENQERDLRTDTTSKTLKETQPKRKSELSAQEIRVRKERDKRHHKEILEQEKIKVMDDIEKQNDRISIAKEQKNKRDFNLWQKENN